MEKYIHYCWFGGKPLPKLARKCIKSWKKYLPDFEIIEWNENNFDVNITKFSKEAYKQKKWAFVSDVARIYALKNYGGIYFDTDMIVKKNIDELLKHEVVAGWESEYNVAVGVLTSKHKENELINKLWNFYCENDFSVENVYSLSIPTVLTNILKSDYNLKSNHLENQELPTGIKIYARDYFYPISCDKTPNMFTNRTRMIHYYMGSWLTDSDKKRIKFQMVFGKKMGNTLLNFLVWTKHTIKKIAKFFLYPYVLYRRKKNKNYTYLVEKQEFFEQTNSIKKYDYVALYNKYWLGTQYATKELFENCIGITEMNDERNVQDIVDFIIAKQIKLVIFSAFSKGWNKIVKSLKEKDPNIVIKVIWHGSNAMNVEYYDWEMFEEIFKLHDKKLINSIAFVKKSMYEFYKKKNYRVELLLNTVHLPKIKVEKHKSDKTKIGLYASGDRWVKNFYNQLAAASLFPNASIDCIPLGEKTIKMAKIFDVSISGLSSSLPRTKLLERIGKNDINFYVTFSECAPMLPLESFELGVPCITAHNHHYWEGTELAKYLIVDENDNVNKIYEKAEFCLKNKEKVLELYKNWKREYDKEAKKSVNKFLNRS